MATEEDANERRRRATKATTESRRTRPLEPSATDERASVRDAGAESTTATRPTPTEDEPTTTSRRRRRVADAARHAALRLRGVLRGRDRASRSSSSKVARLRLAASSQTLEADDRRAARRDRDAARRRSSARSSPSTTGTARDARSSPTRSRPSSSKVTWPSRDGGHQLDTFVVIVTTVVSTVFFALMDRFWGFVTNLVYGLSGS